MPPLPQKKLSPGTPALPRHAPTHYQVQGVLLFDGALPTPTGVVREAGSRDDELACLRDASAAIDGGSRTVYVVQTLRLVNGSWTVARETIPVAQRKVARAEWRRLVDFDTDTQRAVFVERTAHHGKQKTEE